MSRTAVLATPRWRSFDAGRALLWSVRSLVAGGVLFAVFLQSHVDSRLSLVLWQGQEAAAGRLPFTTGSETFTGAGAPLGAVGWLHDLLVYGAVDLGGWGGLAAATATLAVLALLLVDARAARQTRPGLAIVATLLVAGSIATQLRIGAPVLSWVCAAALVLALDRVTARTPIFAALIAVLWCNVAADGILAPVFALLAVVRAGGEAKRGVVPSPELRKAIFVTILATLGATLLTPAGPFYHAAAIRALGLSDVRPALDGAFPVDVAGNSYRLAFVALVVAAIAVGTRGGQRVGNAPRAILVLALALRNGAELPLAAIVIAPEVVASLAAAFALGTERRSYAALPSSILLATVATLGALMAINADARDEAAFAHSDDLALIRRIPADRPHHVLCTALVWCDTVVARGEPNLPVFMDTRTWTFPLNVRDQQELVVRATEDWRQVLANNRVDVVLISPKGASAYLLSGPWKRFGSTDQLLVLMRR